jgi:hypothetical protein
VIELHTGDKHADNLPAQQAGQHLNFSGDCYSVLPTSAVIQAIGQGKAILRAGWPLVNYPGDD